MLAIFKNCKKAAPVADRPGSESSPHHIRFNGHSAGILDIYDEGQRINVCVFGPYRDLKAGDYVIFERRNGETTRYKIDRIHTPHDPGDQHFLYCSFAPRPAPTSQQ